MLTWCKLHTDILGDAKLLRAARKGARHLVILPWLMAWARAHDESDLGRLVLDGDPVEPEDIAAQLPGVTASAVRGCLTAAESIGVLVREKDGALRFAAWDTRSGPKSSRPSDAPDAVRERVRKHRQDKRLHAEPAPEPVTTGNDGNALPNATDREREKEGELDERTTQSPSTARVPDSPSIRALRPRLPVEYHPDFDALLARLNASQQTSWCSILRVMLDGGMDGPMVPPVALGLALREFAANAAVPNVAHFRGYVRRAAAPPDDRPAPPGARNAFRAGSRESAGQETYDAAFAVATAMQEAERLKRPA